MASKALKLTDQQELLAIKYLETGNQAAAYRAAYPSSGKLAPETVYKKASVAFQTDGKVWGRVKELREKELADVFTDVRESIREANRIAFSNPADYFDENGDLKPIDQLTPAQAAAIASVEVISHVEEGEEGEAVRIQTKKIKFWDKCKALDMLLKVHGAFKEQPQQQTNIQININHGEPA